MKSDRATFLKRAEEARTVADNMWDPDAAIAWRRIAETYEHMANSSLLIENQDKFS